MSSRIFRKKFEIQVPARGLFGKLPSRKETFTFTLPSNFKIERHSENSGVKVSNVNLSGLNEKLRKFSATENGVKLEWELSNSQSFPINGRTAFIELELKGQPVVEMSLSPKYQSLRQRFIENFFYEGIVAEFIDPATAGKRIKFADQTLYLGQAIIALATERAILRAGNNQSELTENHSRISTLLDAIDRLDLAGETYVGAQPVLDGFFVRDDVTGPSDPRLQGQFAACDSDYQNPEKENATPSGDQIFGMMYGLSSVTHFAGDADLVTRAQEICSRLFNYAMRNYFVLKLPNGNPTRRGSDMRWLASLMQDLNKDATGQDLYDQCQIEVLGHKSSLDTIAAFWASDVTANLTAKLAGLKIYIPIIDEEIELNSFALHIILMALAPVNTWTQIQVENVAIKVNHHASIMLYCARHANTLPISFDRDTITNILAACPDTGPAASAPASSGWNYDNRWVRCSKVGTPTEGPEIYNGIDWMILHNLDQLVYIGTPGESSMPIA